MRCSECGKDWSTFDYTLIEFDRARRHATLRVMRAPLFFAVLSLIFGTSAAVVPHASVALTMTLRAFYENEPRVVIEDSPRDLWLNFPKARQSTSGLAVTCRSNARLTNWISKISISPTSIAVTGKSMDCSS